MKLAFLILTLLGLAVALPQDPIPPPADEPPAPPPSDKPPAPLPVPPTDEPAPEPVPTTQPAPAPQPPPSTPAPGVPAPTVTGGPVGKPICECGYTYCASVLKAMKEPWTDAELSDAYCNTPNATCPDGSPRTDVGKSLFVCLCDDVEQKLGTELNLLCGCDECLVVGPDYRGRCASPCYNHCDAEL